MTWCATNICEGFVGICNNKGELRECRTRYADDEQNTCPVLCNDCYEAYTEHWDWMWDQYYSGLL